MKYYVLENGEPRPATLKEFGPWFETAKDRVLSVTYINHDCHVSTVFLGMDHRVSDNGPPVLWETMIFGGDDDGWQERDVSKIDAMLTHRRACLVAITSDGDWAEVFADHSSGNVSKEVTESADDAPVQPYPTREDVIEVLDTHVSAGDYAEWQGYGVFLLKDGRYLYAQGGCDTTGWDCQASNELIVASNLKNLVVLGMDDSARVTFPDLVRRALWPADVREDAPPGIVADYVQDQGDEGTAMILRKLTK